MLKRNWYLVFLCFACLSGGCNQVPADMFPKSVGSFQLKDIPQSWTDKKGNKVYDGKYISPDNKTISCHGFDASSEQEADLSVKEYDSSAGAQQTKPLLDKSGKRIGLTLLSPRDTTSSLAWSNGKRSYLCNTEENGKTLEEFDQNWQSQNSK
jgi:hypothetical protein